MEQAENLENFTVRRAAEGDRGSFESLVQQCAEQIYNLAFRLTGNRADAEDLAQEAFVAAFRHLSKFEGRSSFASWVYRITVNLWKNRVKYEKRRLFFRHLSLDRLRESEEDEMSVQAASNEPDPLTLAERGDQSGRVGRLLNKLPPEERLLIVLCDIEEKSYEEIAQLLGCPLGTVKSRLARARESLRKEWLNELHGH